MEQIFSIISTFKTYSKDFKFCKHLDDFIVFLLNSLFLLIPVHHCLQMDMQLLSFQICIFCNSERCLQSTIAVKCLKNVYLSFICSIKMSQLY